MRSRGGDGPTRAGSPALAAAAVTDKEDAALSTAAAVPLQHRGVCGRLCRAGSSRAGGKVGLVPSSCCTDCSALCAGHGAAQGAST